MEINFVFLLKPNKLHIIQAYMSTTTTPDDEIEVIYGLIEAHTTNISQVKCYYHERFQCEGGNSIHIFAKQLTDLDLVFVMIEKKGFQDLEPQ